MRSESSFFARALRRWSASDQPAQTPRHERGASETTLAAAPQSVSSLHFSGQRYTRRTVWLVTLGAFAYRRGYPHAETIAAMILCSACGSDRLIPLSFAAPWRHDRYLGHPESKPLPVIKCIRCGKRTYVSVRVHRSLSSG
jgi:hypothetical protein